MCLITTQTVPSVTSSEMIVWKIMAQSVNGQSLVAPFQRHRYINNERQPTVDLKLVSVAEGVPSLMCDVDCDWLTDNFRTDPASRTSWRRNAGLFSISEGYHSLVACGKFTREIWDNVNAGNDYVMVKCIIPAGVKYYMNARDMIVSETIVVTDDIIYLTK